MAAVHSLTTGSKGHSSPLVSVHLNLCIKGTPYLLIHLFTCLLFPFIRCSFPKSCVFSVLPVPGTGKWSVAIGHVTAPCLTTLGSGRPVPSPTASLPDAVSSLPAVLPSCHTCLPLFEHLLKCVSCFLRSPPTRQIAL